MGERLQYHVDRKEKRVWIYTEGSFITKHEGIERSKFLPDLVNDAFENLSENNFILDSETVWYRNNRPLPREQMVSIAVGKDKIVGEDIRVFVFDILWLNGKDLTGLGYLDRKELLRRVLRKDTKHFKFVESIPINSEESFKRTYEELSLIQGSEGAMIKTTDWKYPKNGITSGMSKLKKLFEYNAQIIGIRKIPGAKSENKTSSETMMKILPELLKKSKTYTFRVAFKGPDGKLMPVYADKKYAPGDLKLQWDEERQRWRGVEGEDAGWKMSKDFEQAKESEQALGNTYNSAVPEGSKEPELGDIISIAPAVMRAWKDNGKIMVSHTFPRVSAFKFETKEPDDYKQINEILKAVALRHGKKEPELVLESCIEVKEELSKMDELVEVKQVFGSPGGKRFLAKRIVTLLPENKKYGEPFCGGAAVLFSKPPSDKEMINDMNKDIAQAYRYIQSLTDSEIDSLSKRDWSGSREKWHYLHDLKPVRKLDWLYRFLYVKRHSYGGSSERSGIKGAEYGEGFFKNLKLARDRLKGVEIKSEDAMKLIPKWDSEDTTWYFDPPYPEKKENWEGIGWIEMDDLVAMAKKIKGKFIMSLQASGKVRNAFDGFKIRTIKTVNYSQVHRWNDGAPKFRTEMIIANFEMSRLRSSSFGSEFLFETDDDYSNYSNIALDKMLDNIREVTGFSGWLPEDLTELCLTH